MDCRLIEWLENYYKPEHIAFHFLKSLKDIYFSDNMQAYCALARARQNIDFYRLMPMYEKPGPAFWLECRASDDEPLWIVAAKRYVWLDTNLSQELPNILEEPCDCSHLVGGSIAGKLSFSGGLWVNPNHRKSGIGTLATKALHACALLLWNPDYFFGVTEVRLKALSVNQGWAHIETMGQWQSQRFQTTYDLNLCWMTGQHALLSLLRQHD